MKITQIMYKYLCMRIKYNTHMVIIKLFLYIKQIRPVGRPFVGASYM